jgi:GH24 family phage-related lysozyme (muramidase)
MLKLIKDNPSNPKIKDEFIKWRNKGSKFENGLRRRREAEANLYFTI